jgi:hypothetical protein
MPFARPKLLGTLLTLSLLTSCATTLTGTGATEPPVVHDLCLVMTKPIALSRQDTDATIRQVLALNKAWRAVCGAVKP